MATSLFCETFLFPASALLPWLSAGTCLLAAAAVALLVLLLRERRAAAGEGKRADDAFGNAVRDLRDDAERTRTALEQAIRDFREESAAAAQRRERAGSEVAGKRAILASAGAGTPFFLRSIAAGIAFSKIAGLISARVKGLPSASTRAFSRLFFGNGNGGGPRERKKKGVPAGTAGTSP